MKIAMLHAPVAHQLRQRSRHPEDCDEGLSCHPEDRNEDLGRIRSETTWRDNQRRVSTSNYDVFPASNVNSSQYLPSNNEMAKRVSSQTI